MSETPSELAAARREIDRLRAENFGAQAFARRPRPQARRSHLLDVVAHHRAAAHAGGCAAPAPLAAPLARAAQPPRELRDRPRRVSALGAQLLVDRCHDARVSRVGRRGARPPSAHLGDHAELQHRSEMDARGDRVGARPDLSALGIVHFRRCLDTPRRARTARKLCGTGQTHPRHVPLGQRPYLGEFQHRARPRHRRLHRAARCRRSVDRGRAVLGRA